jgi:dihydrodipicolinate synthase/N-acetylneuraminate lyase
MKLSWQGVMPALLTPFKSNDSIDFLTFEKNTRAQLDAGGFMDLSLEELLEKQVP